MKSTPIKAAKPYNTAPVSKTPVASNASGKASSGVGYKTSRTGAPTQSSPGTTGQGRNTGVDKSDYQKYLNDGVNPNDWRDPVADSSALNSQAQEMFEKQLKQVSEMNRQGASKKGKEERQTAGMQQASNERIAQIQSAPTRKSKERGIPQSSATLQYNANAQARLSRFASKAEKQAAQRHDAKTIASQFKQDRRMAMKTRGHQAQMAQLSGLQQRQSAFGQRLEATKDRRNQQKMQQLQVEGDLKRTAAESAARLKETQMQLAGQERIADKTIQGDITKTYINSALSATNNGGFGGGYW